MYVKMYVMAVFSSSDFYSSHFSVIECEGHILSNKTKNIHEVCFKSKLR